MLVMLVALVVLAAVVGLLQMVGELRSIGGRDGGPIPGLIGLSAAATASGLVSWRLTRRLAEPIEAASTATDELAAGRYDIRLDRADTDELDDLAIAVNELAHSLETTEQRRLRLIGDVAHELRNPLSTIEGTMEALLDGVVAPSEETYARVGREAARLRRLADDLSSLSAAGELGMNVRTAVDLGALVFDVVEQLQPQAAAKGLALDAVIPDGCYVQGDPDRLVQVVTNVIGNAVQYTDAGGISVRLATGSHRIGIEVVDTGRGLATEDQVRIFDRFHRVDEQFTDGTGVGLAIAKLLVNAHGGTIAASSPGLGAGTTVRIDLPMAPPP